MIELDTQTRRKSPPTESKERANYLILGDFGGQPTKPIPIDRDTFPHLLNRLEVTLLGERVRELDDFHPDKLFQRPGIFDDLRDDAPAPKPKLRDSPSANLDDILRPTTVLEQMTSGADDPLKKYARELGKIHGEAAPKSNPEKASALADRMRELLRDPAVQKLEAAWRGLEFAVNRIDDESARIYVAQFSKDDLVSDLLPAEDLTKTRACALFHSNHWRGIIGLYSFGPESTDIELLGRLALLAASADAPFVAEGCEDMGTDWDDLRAIPEAAFVGLALPPFLLRLPYGAESNPIQSFKFEEMPGVPEHSAYLWGNPALACLSLAAGPSRGTDLDLRDLPSHVYEEDDEWKRTLCAEALMNENRVYGLMAAGLMPLVSYRDSDRVRLAGFRSINNQPLPLPLP